MSAAILATKLYVPPHRANIVLRPRLTEGMRHKLTLISAPAGFGKATLLSEWVAAYKGPAAWLSLDEGDKAPTRFWRISLPPYRHLPQILERVHWARSKPLTL